MDRRRNAKNRLAGWSPCLRASNIKQSHTRGKIAQLRAIRVRERDLSNGDVVENRRKFGEMILENPALIGGALGFAFLAVVIISNAAFLQVERHPAPIFGAGDWSPTVSSRSNSIPVPRRQPLLIQEIQQALADRGYYGGDIDGRIGPKTRSSILAFQRAENLPTTGVATSQLLRQINASEGLLLPPEQPTPSQTASIPTRPIAVEQPALDSPAQVRKLQGALDQLGYGPIQIDGVNGAQTVAAIKGFQLDHGMQPDGLISPGLWSRIEVFGGISLTEQ